MRNGDETKNDRGKCQPESGSDDRRTQAPDGRRGLNKRINEVWRSMAHQHHNTVLGL